MTPIELIVRALDDYNRNPKRSGKGWSACCPAHDDKHPSLSISEGEDGRALVHCHAGCTVEAVCAAVGLRVVDLMPTTNKLTASNKTKKNGKGRIITKYEYRDEAGKVLFEVVRFEPKDFRQRRPKAGGGWDWSVKGVRAVPYRLPELLAEPKRPVVVVEGEKDVENLAKIEVLATCNAGGAGKWKAEHAEFLRGRSVIVLADNDESGRTHAQQVALTLQGIATFVRVIKLPGLPSKGDPSDWIAAGGTRDELKRLASATPEWKPAAVPQPWPKIDSYDDQKLSDFPTSVLPGALREWVEAESQATQTPPDLAGLLALAVCSAVIARRVVVEPRPGWREPVNLFVAVLLAPGNRKSAVFGDAMKPLRKLEADLIEAARPEVARAISDRRQDETRLKSLEKKASQKGDANARHEAGILAADLAEKIEPVLPRLIVDDATSEKLGIMLAQQGARIASMSPEGGVFDLMAGLYSKSGFPQFGVYLMGHSGDDLITDRVSRETVRVERPALTCAYAMQPQVIKGLAENAAFRGRGLLARFLYAAPESWIGLRKIAPPPVSEKVREGYHHAVQRLAELEGERVLTLTDEASSALKEWEAEIETMLGDGGHMEMMRDWGSKLAGATLRLAAVLHCLEHDPDSRIDAATFAAAVEIAIYLVPHAGAVFEMMVATDGSSQSKDDGARYVLRWIERHNRREFSKRDVHQHGKQRFPKADDIDLALKELTRRGYIRLLPSGPKGPGRPPSPRYEVNPLAFADPNPEKRPHNSHNLAEDHKTGNSENIESALGHSENGNRVQVTI